MAPTRTGVHIQGAISCGLAAGKALKELSYLVLNSKTCSTSFNGGRAP